MTDRPYTDDDLRTEAAKQHKTATEDPDFSGIGEQMDGTEPWTNLGDDDFDTAMRAIDDLLGNAADVSRWAIDLGADGLNPDVHTIDVGWTDGPLQARLLIAFDKDMPDDERQQLAEDIRDAIAGTVPVR